MVTPVYLYFSFSLYGGKFILIILRGQYYKFKKFKVRMKNKDTGKVTTLKNSIKN